MTELFIMLLITGLFLIGAEVFIPGGVLGLIGGIALIGASIAAFADPGISNTAATAITGGIVISIGVVIYLWIRFFPKTPVGKKMTVSRDLHSAKGTEGGLAELLGKRGVTISPLHPGGYAEIEGRRVDVITMGEMVGRDKDIKVIEIEGNRVVVEAAEAEKE